MITVIYNGVSQKLPHRPGIVAAHLYTLAEQGLPVAWESDDTEEEARLTSILCVAYGVPCRSEIEREIEAYGGSPDRVNSFVTPTYPPS